MSDQVDFGDRGSARRARGPRVAIVLVAVALVALVAAWAGTRGGSSAPPSTAPADVARSSSAPAAAPDDTARPLVVPARARGELARAVYDRSRGARTATAVVTKPIRGREYVVQGACESEVSGTGFDYRVVDADQAGTGAGSGDIIAAGVITCDGHVTIDSASPLPAKRVKVTLDGPFEQAERVYAVIVPAEAASD